MPRLEGARASGIPRVYPPAMARPDPSDPLGRLQDPGPGTGKPDPQKLKALIRQNRVLPAPEAELPVIADRVDRILAVLDAMGIWVTEFDATGNMIFCNEQTRPILGFTAAECLSSDCLEFHPDDLAIVRETGRHVRETGMPAANEARLRHRDGHWVWTATTLMAWTPTKDGEFHTISLSRDLSPLKQAEAGRRESEDRYRLVTQMSCDLIFESDADGNPTYIGPGVMEILGYSEEEALELETWSIIHPDDVPRVREQYEREFAAPVEPPAASAPQLMEYRIQHRDGRWLWFETLGRTYVRADGEKRFLGVARDVTERKLAEEARRELEESMQRAQKLESLGVLAGGIAHDFNNLLTPILGAAGLGLDELPEDSPVRIRFEKIQQAARRAAALTNQMLAYAGQRPLQVERIDLSQLVSEMRQLVTSSISGRTQLELDLAPNLPMIEVEAAQIAQVVMNLITNAVESLGDGSGRIRLETGEVMLDAPPSGALFADTMKPGRHVFLRVADTGAGMDADTRLRIFDPFYTTKFTGRGLGLAAVAGIVRSHSGAIEVESEPGHGTTIRVLLPAREASSAAAPEPSDAVGSFETHGIALVIDDDDDVRLLAQDVLQRRGMTVLTAADGHEGVKLFAQHAGDVRVVLLDRTMPLLSGSDALEAIQSLRPDVPIVVVSGYSKESVESELRGRRIAGFLAKPFAPETLVTRVRAALEPADGS